MLRGGPLETNGAGQLNSFKRRRLKMSCEFLIGRQIKMCGAFNCTLILSVDELEGKCNTDSYHTCRIYQKRMKKGAKLPLKEYLKGYSLPPTA